MTVDIQTLEGPLEDGGLDSIAELYGRVDPKYATRAQLDHLFANAPAAPALHAFAYDRGRAVGHCAVVPMTARTAGRAFLCGKVEALVVEEAYRGSRASSPPVALRLREALYALADARGVELLHAYVRPEVGRVLGLTPVPAGPPSRVAVLRPRTLATARLRLPAVALSAAQRAALAAVDAIGARGNGAVAREPTAADVDLVRVPAPQSGRWTVLAEDTWEWYRGSPYLRVLEIDGARALVQLPGAVGDALRLISWVPRRGDSGAARRLLAAAASHARPFGAGSIRYQPWPGRQETTILVQACRLMGFVNRNDFTALYVRAREPQLVPGDAVVPTPLLALGF